MTIVVRFIVPACVIFILVASAAYGLLGFLFSVGIITVLWLAIKVRPLSVRYILFLVASFGAWFLLIHSVEEASECTACHSGIYEERLEILGIHLYTYSIDQNLTPITIAAEYFGRPCPHSQMETLLIVDYWGMFHRLQRHDGSSFYFTGNLSPEREKKFRDIIRPEVERIREHRPEQIEEFYKHVIEQQDLEYWIQFSREVLMMPDVIE